MFELGESESFPEREQKVLEFWKKENIFEHSLKKTQNGPSFSFYDGPPFATGLPHYGHILAGTIKDVIPRFRTMKGYHVIRRFGWDCHGLPVENEIEKAHQLSGAPEIEKFGIAKFNEECRKIVLRYTQEWQTTVERMGRWVDFRQTYHTMDKSFMESVWWVFSELYKKGLVYEGLKVMPFSAKLGTPLSNFEANLNYRDVDDPSVVVMFCLEESPEVCLIAWTTTPWTLPSNLALAVHPQIDYVKIKETETGRIFIVAEARVQAHFKAYEILERMKGSALVGLKYKPLFSYFADDLSHTAFRVLGDEFVSIEDGTGIVHLAPAFGEADFFACQKAGIEPVCPVDQNGKYTKEVPEFEGVFVKDADKEILRRLKQEKKVLSHTQIRHRYPFCWRSDTPLIYKAVKTWFVAVENIKDQLLEANQEIQWVPEHIKEGRFGKWLESARDWAISRNRYWGTPIPIWRSEDGDIIVISSVKELQEKTGKEIVDLHRHFIDDLTFTYQGKQFKRIPEVFDCWFESGSMPYAQNHYPFENEALTLNNFPADFIGEGLDQTRGWFYTLTVLAVALFNKPAFKNVVVNGIVLAEDGTKMSKRLKNYPEPMAMVNQFGADAVRFYLMGSPAVVADDLKFSARGVELVLRQLLIPFWNCYVFLATYSQIYQFIPSETVSFPSADIDRWILSELQTLIEKVTEEMENYQIQKAALPLQQFIDHLTDWYIRRSRSRFWADEETSDRTEAFQTLYTVLQTLCRITAPFIPFISESIYRQLRKKTDPISVHLAPFPQPQSHLKRPDLENEMKWVQKAVSLGHALRKENKLKVRQPLSVAHLACGDQDQLASLQRQSHLVAEELNVKRVEFHADESLFVKLKAKANFRVLGKKVGKRMAAAQHSIEKLDANQLYALLRGESLSIPLEGETMQLSPEDVAVVREVKPGMIAHTSEGLTIALDTNLSEELILEGIARELINKINMMRKEHNFAVTDRIHLKIQTSSDVKKAFEIHRELICHETLILSFEFTSCEGDVWDINGHSTTLSIRKHEKL